jgi:hypothetical protein
MGLVNSVSPLLNCPIPLSVVPRQSEMIVAVVAAGGVAESVKPEPQLLLRPQPLHPVYFLSAAAVQVPLGQGAELTEERLRDAAVPAFQFVTTATRQRYLYKSRLTPSRWVVRAPLSFLLPIRYLHRRRTDQTNRLSRQMNLLHWSTYLKKRASFRLVTIQDQMPQQR